MPESSQRPRRGQRTRYDRSRRNTLIITVVIATLVVVGALTAFFVSQRQDAEAIGALRRNVDDRPRNTDLWFVYPDGTVRFVALFFPAGGEELYSAAGPLLNSEDDILSEAAINAEIESDEVLDGPNENEALVFSLYELNYTGSGEEPYGVDVLTENSAYVSPAPLGSLLLLGTNAQPTFQQVIVAVAFPQDTNITIRDLSLTPYRERTIRGWDVYYFDTGEALPTDAIRLEYLIEADEPPREPDYLQIDRQR